MLSVIIQARMRSSRLPGKVLKTILGKPLRFLYLIERIKTLNEIKNIIIATTQHTDDDIIQKFCEDKNIKFFRGSENNLVERFYLTSKKFGCDPIIRLTSDCPLMDPNVLRRQIKYFNERKCDYSYLGLTYPEGICSDMFTFETLDKIYKNAKTSLELEHITPYIKKNKSKFYIEELKDTKDNSKFRFTVDYKEDFILIEKIIKSLYKDGSVNFSYNDVVDLLSKNKDLFEINSKINRNEWSINDSMLSQ